MSVLWADIKSTTGNLLFDIDRDQNAEMIMNGGRLGIGIDPSTNLHVDGNVIMSQSLVVGAQTGSSNFGIHGTMAFSVESVASDQTLGDHSYVLADSSSQDLTLTLPSASSSNRRVITIKKSSDLNEVFVTGSFEEAELIILNASSSPLPWLTVISDGSTWITLSQYGAMDGVIAQGNLLGYWKLDDTSGTTATDSSGRGMDGTTTNGQSFDNDAVVGVVGGALQFDGSGDYVDLPDIDLNTSAGTVMFWALGRSGSQQYAVANVQPQRMYLGQSSTGQVYARLDGVTVAFASNRYLGSPRHALEQRWHSGLLYQWFASGIGDQPRHLHHRCGQCLQYRLLQ